MKRFTPALCFAPAFALATAACGGSGLSGSTDRPSTLATVRGEIDNPVKLPLDSNAFRVAIVWGVAGADGGFTSLRTAVDVSVTPAFPAQFQLSLTEPPPAEAMVSIPKTSIKYAYGSIVAYEDTNQNGELDLIDPNATTAIDKVLAVPTDTTLVYFEGGDPSISTDDNGTSATAGFNLYVTQPLGEWACNGGPIIDGVTPPACPGFVWEPISTPLTLTLSNDPELSAYMCGRTPTASTGTSGSSTDMPNLGDYVADFNGNPPVKSDPHLVCEPDGKSFSYASCTSVPGTSLCDIATQCTSKTYVFEAGDTGWPCPMK